MRILGIGEYNGLADMHWRIASRGHEVRVFVEEEAHGIYAGMLTRSENWKRELPWIREAGDEGIIVFESAAKGPLQDELRREGFKVVGGSAGGDRLENDRAWGQEMMRQSGMRTAATWTFHGFEEALEFLSRRPARYVFKLNDPEAASTRNYVGELGDGRDIAELLHVEQRRWKRQQPPDFVLMEHLQGVEVGVGGYFNGQEFLGPVCMDWEHKRFFPGDLGELTGEMGTVVTYSAPRRLFNETLGRTAGLLRELGYRGYINLNLIVNEAGVWPLEFTSRFGYPGFAICDALHEDGWELILQAMATGRARDFRTRPGYAVGVVLTVPPFPYEYGYQTLSRGVPLLFREELSAAEQERLHHGEVGLDAEGRLVTAGSLGYITVATGCGADCERARAAAYALARKVVLPNLRYRRDIGERFIERDREQLWKLGYLG